MEVGDLATEAGAGRTRAPKEAGWYTGLGTWPLNLHRLDREKPCVSVLSRSLEGRVADGRVPAESTISVGR